MLSEYILRNIVHNKIQMGLKINFIQNMVRPWWCWEVATAPPAVAAAYDNDVGGGGGAPPGAGDGKELQKFPIKQCEKY